MRRERWLGVCRWVHVLLVLGYIFLTIMLIIVLLVVFGVRLADWVRWVMLIGWFAVCLGGVWVVERPGVLPGCRLPILAEEERLAAMMDAVQKAAGLKMQVRFLIRTVAEKRDCSMGYRTILISSGALQWASDAELRGMLAHELGHLRDGDRVLEAAFVCAGVWAMGFRWGWRSIRSGLKFAVLPGVLLLVLLAPVLLILLLFYVLEMIFRGLRWGLIRWGEYRQDRFAVRSGCGDGLRAWLEKSGLAANVDRIRRLEKLADLRR